MAINIHLFIITLNVNGLILQSKNIEWLNGLKNDTHIYAA